MLTDPRIDKLAQMLVSHSISLKPGEKVLLDMHDTPENVTISLVNAVVAKGGLPFVSLSNAKISRAVAKNAVEEQYSIKADVDLFQMQKMDAYIAIRASDNIAEISDLDSSKIHMISKLMRKVIDYRVGKTKWCILRWPTPAMAQQSYMSTEAFEDYFFNVCLMDFAKITPAMERLQKLMEKTDKVHIKGNGTDLQFSIKNIPAIICNGKHNIPDGEVFTAPVKDSVNGEISYNAPSIYRGVAFDNVKLTFKNGQITKATSPGRQKEIEAIFNADEGAKFVGEFAIGLNNKITKPIRDILFDEKIGGSFHFTPGQAYELADNGNRSQIHWDLVCMQNPENGGGEIYFDEVLIRKDGKFTLPEFSELNEI